MFEDKCIAIRTLNHGRHTSCLDRIGIFKDPLAVLQQVLDNLIEVETA